MSADECSLSICGEWSATDFDIDSKIFIAAHPWDCLTSKLEWRIGMSVGAWMEGHQSTLGMVDFESPLV